MPSSAEADLPAGNDISPFLRLCGERFPLPSPGRISESIWKYSFFLSSSLLGSRGKEGYLHEVRVDHLIRGKNWLHSVLSSFVLFLFSLLKKLFVSRVQIIIWHLHALHRWAPQKPSHPPPPYSLLFTLFGYPPPHGNHDLFSLSKSLFSSTNFGLCSSFSSSLRCEVRSLTWEYSCFLR